MADIKGITIEFRGDTTELSKAINKVRKETRDLDKELGYIDRSLKFNPGNVDLLRQKMAILNKATEDGEKNIEELKKALQKMKDSGVDETSADYRELEREIIKAESKQKAYNAELKKVQAAASGLGRASAAMKEFGNKATKAGEALRGVSTLAAGFDAALGTLAYKSGKAADDLDTLSKVTGISTQELQKYKAAADLVDVSVDSIAKSQIKMKKSMASAQQGSAAASEAFAALGVSVEDSNGHLRNQDDVFAETIAALGQMENETERDALAMQIFGKSAAQLNPLIEDQGETYKRVAEIFKNNGLELVDEETIAQAKAFNDQLDTIKATWGAALNTIGMQLAGYLAPVLEKVAGVLEKVAAWLSSLSPETLTMIGIIAGIVAGLAPLLLIVGKLAMAISSIMGLMSTLGVTFGALAGPVGIAIAAIGAAIAIGVALYKNWDKIKAKAAEIKDWIVEKWTALKLGLTVIMDAIKAKVAAVWDGIKTTTTNAFNALKNTVSSIWNGIKTAITHPIETALTLIKTIIDKIKALFSNLNIKLPKIKLPHFTIQPPGWKIGDLLQGKIPKLGISWYDKGGIFKSPTVIGVGEKRPEFVGALDDLRDIVRQEAGAITVNVYGSPGMNEEELANIVLDKIIAAQKRRRNAWA